MKKLNFKTTQIDEYTIELIVVLEFNNIKGVSESYLSLTQLKESAKIFAQYPIPSDGSVFLGSYLSEASPASELGSLYIGAKPNDARGNISLQIQLFSTSPKSFNSTFFQSNLTCTLPVTYTQLNDISKALTGFVNGYQDEYVIDL